MQNSIRSKRKTFLSDETAREATRILTLDVYPVKNMFLPNLTLLPHNDVVVFV